MLNHIDLEQLKQDFLHYLSFLILPLSEILIEKIPPTFQKTKLSQIKTQSDNRKILLIRSANKVECTLTKSDLGEYGLNIESFREELEDIKNENSKETLLKAIQKILILHNEKLCQIYIPKAILAFTILYEEFKHINPKEKTHENIYAIIFASCLKGIKSTELCYNFLSFTMAYQYPHLETISLLDTIPFDQNTTSTAKDTCSTILNLVQHIQKTAAYRETYINLINSIEELDSLQFKDKTVNAYLISELKNLTNQCFSSLLQVASYERSEKFKYEKEITEKFRDNCIQSISLYQKEHPNAFKKQWNVLYSILRLIVNLIPTPILSNKKKMTFFLYKEENNTKKITEITSKLDQLATSNFFSRIF